MGAGNWFPKPFNEADFEVDFRMVYLNLMQNVDTEGMSEFQERYTENREYENFKEFLATLLPASFERIDERTYVGDDSKELLFAQNGQLMVTIAPNQTSTAVVVRSRDDLRTHEYRLSERRIDGAADKIFDALAKSYNLTVRAGVWCSGEYVPTALRN